MPKLYTHSESNYEIDSSSLLKIMYMVNDTKGKMMAEAWSNPNTEAEDGDNEDVGPKFQWDDQQVMNIESMFDASILIVSIVSINIDTGETIKVAKGILDLSEAQIFTKLNEKYNKFMQKIKISLDLENEDDTAEFVVTVKWSPDKKSGADDTLQFKT